MTFVIIIISPSYYVLWHQCDHDTNMLSTWHHHDINETSPLPNLQAPCKFIILQLYPVASYSEIYFFITLIFIVVIHQFKDLSWRILFIWKLNIRKHCKFKQKISANAWRIRDNFSLYWYIYTEMPWSMQQDMQTKDDHVQFYSVQVFPLSESSNLLNHQHAQQPILLAHHVWLLTRLSFILMIW